MMLWRTSICLLVCALFLCGCAARDRRAGTPASSHESGFAAQLAAMPAGSTQYMAESPFGPATVTVEAPYTSGLGNSCRLVYVMHGDTGEKRAICRENGVWYFLPRIFESIPQ